VREEAVVKIAKKNQEKIVGGSFCNIHIKLCKTGKKGGQSFLVQKARKQQGYKIV